MSENAKYNVAIKASVIFLLIIIFIIPTIFINSLVRDRQMRQEAAIREVSSKWAETQTIAGPIVSIPYYEYFKTQSGTVEKQKKYMHILPDELNIEGNLFPEKRYRGIYEVVVYGSKLKFNGSFSSLSLGDPSVQKQNILFNEAFVSVGISDLRGLEDQIAIKWNNDESSFNPGVESFDIIKSGINASIKINPSDTGDVKYNFLFNLNLKGSQYIYFTPVGKETKVNLSSEWTTPSFDGAFLPDKREIDAKGFKAYWKVLHLNRNYPQRWISDKYTVDNSAFGINLIVPIDHYTKTDRSIKYAILFIALTFLIFFFLELINNKAVHFIQYTLIGFALCIFYVLLLSISEHLPYNFAYWIASAMTIGLIAWYTRSILRDKKLSALVAGNLLLLYGFIFTIIQLEDYALLIGSLGLFLILAVVMYFSKKIDWASLSGK